MDWKLGGLALAALFVTSCERPDPRPEQIREWVRAALKDPESARFGEELLLSGSGMNMIACGTVNAKNSFGGYIGETNFMVYDGKLFLASDRDTDLATVLCCTALYAATREGLKQISQEDSSYCRNTAAGMPLPMGDAAGG